MFNAKLTKNQYAQKKALQTPLFVNLNLFQILKNMKIIKRDSEINSD